MQRPNSALVTDACDAALLRRGTTRTLGIMEASISRSNRAKSALMMGAAFLVLFWISLMVASVIPVVGALVQAAVFFGSPFTWALAASGQLKGAHPYLLGFAIAAPYPLMGLIIGYAWPGNFPESGEFSEQSWLDLRCRAC